MADPDGLPGRGTPAVLSLVTAGLLVLGASCTSDSPSNDANATDAASVAPTRLVEPAAIDTGSTRSNLSDQEIAGLVWIREEEQLAHDVYVALGDLWGLRIFENIASSETTHVQAVVDLLDRYGIDDPAAGNEPGTFTDPALQLLYDELTTQGSESLDAALAVGASIEELDIVDLRARADATAETEIITVYNHLERGSRNHLRAFMSQLDRRGGSYEPTQLDQEVFDAIVASDSERGPGS